MGDLECLLAPYTNVLLTADDDDIKRIAERIGVQPEEIETYIGE